MHKISLAARIILIFAVTVLAAGCGKKKAELPYVDPKDLAPDFAIGFDQGRAVSLSGLRGRVVVLSFTLGYVDVCAELREYLKGLYANDIGHKTAFVEIDRDTATLAESTAVVMDSLFAVVHDRAGIAPAYKIQKIPTIVIIDKLGKEVFRHEGYNAETTGLSVLRPQILKAQGK